MLILNLLLVSLFTLVVWGGVAIITGNARMIRDNKKFNKQFPKSF